MTGTGAGDRPVQLVRGLTLLDATLLIVGSVIGSGIFFAPAIMAGYLQSPGLLLALWVLGGLHTLAGALSCADLAAAMPRAGGQYGFPPEAFSPLFVNVLTVVGLFVLRRRRPDLHTGKCNSRLT